MGELQLESTLGQVKLQRRDDDMSLKMFMDDSAFCCRGEFSRRCKREQSLMSFRIRESSRDL